MPSFYRDYVLTGARSSLEVVVNSARSLATRFDETTSVIRSWAGARTKVYDLNYPDVDYVVVTDGMMNLDLLYVAAQHTSDQRLANLATTHVKTTLRNHVRENYSTCHLVNYDARDGSVRNRLTCQGYANESTWARGQAWACTASLPSTTLPRTPSSSRPRAGSLIPLHLQHKDIDSLNWRPV